MGQKPTPKQEQDLAALSDARLLRGLLDLLGQTRRVEADLIAHIAEVDARKLYLREASPSMFAWCVERLHLSEQEAYLRITVARASREHPMLLAMLRDGRLHLSGIALLARHLTPENRDDILRRAAGKAHRQLKELAAELEPKPDAPAKIRKLPARRGVLTPADASELGTYRVPSPANGAEAARTAASEVESSFRSAAESDADSAISERSSPVGTGSVAARPQVTAPSSSPQPPKIEPLAPARYKVQFTADAEFRNELERLRALTRTAVPDGDLGKVIRLAVTRELARLEAKRFAKTKSPRKRLGQTDTRPHSRHIPAAVRRFVQKRDGGRCTYRDRWGRRCTKKHDLEFHHKGAFGRGGDHSPENVALMCRLCRAQRPSGGTGLREGGDGALSAPRES
jgi:hypothetical protein